MLQDFLKYIVMDVLGPWAAFAIAIGLFAWMLETFDGCQKDCSMERLAAAC